jgi:hypothetical protein
MSLYVPDELTSAELDVAAAPYLGGEWALYVSRVAAILIAEIEITAVDTAVLTMAPGVGEPVGHAQMMALAPFKSSSATSFTVFCDIDGALPASFAPPARAADQSFGFQRGYATDVGNAGTIGSPMDLSVGPISVAVESDAVGAKFAIYMLPDLSTYKFIGCVRDLDFNTKSRQAKGVDCGMESDAFVKRGKTQPGEITVGDKLKGFAEGLARYDGSKCTLMAVGIKDGQVSCDRIVFTQFVPTTKHKLPEGDGEAVTDAIGKYVESMFFVAP